MALGIARGKRTRRESAEQFVPETWCLELLSVLFVIKKKLLYATSSNKVLVHHDLDKAHRAAVQVLRPVVYKVLNSST